MSALPPPLPNPFDAIGDEELYWMQVALSYGCLRSKADEAKPHHKHVCALLRILDDQATKRPSKKPSFPGLPPA
jgi:hypothetical protein